MLRGVLAVVASLFNETVKLAKWPFNPTNGRGQYVTPSKRHYLDRWANLAVTIGYRLGQAGVAFGKSLVFDVFAPLVDAVIGIATDLYHSPTNHSRMVLRGVLSIVVALGTATVLILKTAGTVLVAVGMVVIGSLRK